MLNIICVHDIHVQHIYAEVTVVSSVNQIYEYSGWQ